MSYTFHRKPVWHSAHEILELEVKKDQVLTSWLTNLTSLSLRLLECSSLLSNKVIFSGKYISYSEEINALIHQLKAKGLSP